LWLGDSIGRWNGDTLVVDTTNFIGGSMRGRLDASLHLTERFTLVGADTIQYEFTVNDPTVFTRPWTAVMPLARSTARLYEVACHEGNYSLTNILRGARSEEKRRTEGIK
jgi:hypothetical protein